MHLFVENLLNIVEQIRTEENNGIPGSLILIIQLVT